MGALHQVHDRSLVRAKDEGYEVQGRRGGKYRIEKVSAERLRTT